jgi:hypothetical protein
LTTEHADPRGAQEDTKPEAMMGKWVRSMNPKDIHTARFAFELIGAAVVIVVILSLVGVGSFVKIIPQAGISVFAVAYLMAQFIERIVEPFSEAGQDEKRPEGKPFGDSNMIKYLRKKGAAADERERNLLDRMKTKRVISMWGLTSFLGILLCYGTVGLFELSGIHFDPAPLGSSTIGGHAFDSMFSGVIVGGGTKPLHDLISYIQLQKDQKS